MAIGAIHALRESGLRIPEDMAVMGFDNLTSSKYIEGGITTIANPYEDMLSVAVNILTKRTKNPQMSQQQIARIWSSATQPEAAGTLNFALFCVNYFMVAH